VRTPKSDLTCVRNDVDQTFFFDQECVCGVDRTLFAVDEGGETEVEITRKTTHTNSNLFKDSFLCGTKKIGISCVCIVAFKRTYE